MGWMPSRAVRTSRSPATAVELRTFRRPGPRLAFGYVSCRGTTLSISLAAAAIVARLHGDHNGASPRRVLGLPLPYQGWQTHTHEHS